MSQLNTPALIPVEKNAKQLGLHNQSFTFDDIPMIIHDSPKMGVATSKFEPLQHKPQRESILIGVSYSLEFSVLNFICN